MNENIKRCLLPVGVLVASGAANAAVPSEATLAITTAGTDIVTAIGTVIVAMVAVWGVRKLGSKMGWL